MKKRGLNSIQMMWAFISSSKMRRPFLAECALQLHCRDPSRIKILHLCRFIGIKKGTQKVGLWQRPFGTKMSGPWLCWQPSKDLRCLPKCWRRLRQNSPKNVCMIWPFSVWFMKINPKEYECKFGEYVRRKVCRKNKTETFSLQALQPN